MNKVLFFTLTLLLITLVNSFAQSVKNDGVETYISLDKDTFSITEEVILKFEVINGSEEDLTFCKFQTPFEGFMAEFMLIKNIETGKELIYQGPQVKRSKPGKKDDLKIEAKGSKDCEVTLLEVYEFEKKGEYSIQFIGSEINSLPDSNVLIVEVE